MIHTLAEGITISGLSSSLIFIAILDKEISSVTSETSTSLLQKNVKKVMKTKFRHLELPFSMEMPGLSGVINIRGQITSKKKKKE